MHSNTFLESLTSAQFDKFFQMLRIAEAEIRASDSFKKMFMPDPAQPADIYPADTYAGSKPPPELNHKEMRLLIQEFVDTAFEDDPDRVDFYADLNFEEHPLDAPHCNYRNNNETFDYLCELMFNPYEASYYSERDAQRA